MNIRFHRDPDTGDAHCEQHNVSPREVIEVLRGRCHQKAGLDGARIAEGQPDAGRYLRVIYRDDQDDGALFVITAYDLSNRAKASFRRRQKRRRR